jgi:putative ABC transport system permease protein
MGAGRHRLMGQLLTESMVLSLCGGAAGVLLAYWGVGLLRGILPDNVPRASGIQVDTTVLAFAAVVTVATGLLFGLAPALFAARTDLARVLKGGHGGGSGGGNSRRLEKLVAAQLAIGLILVNLAIVLLVSYGNLMRQDLNFTTDDVVVAGVSLVGPTYAEPYQRRAFWDAVLKRVRGLPSVVDASLTSKIPLRGGSNGGVLVNDKVFDPTGQDNLVEYSFVADGYHETMGITVLAGRTFTLRDLETVAVVAQEEGATLELPLVINRTMAEQFWPDESALGKLVRPYSAQEYFRGRVVGVVETTRQWGPAQRALPELYFPHTAEVWGPSANRLLVVHTSGDTETLEAALRAAVLEVDDRIPVSAAYTMADVLHAGTGQRRFSMLLVGLFAATALLLIVAGTYGMMSYAVSQRTHEIGVRVALGADRAGVLRLFVYRAARMLAPGFAFGIFGTFSVSVITRRMVFGINALNPLYVTTAVGIMLLVSAVAIAVPVLRAMRVDPVEALRSE